MQEIHDPLENFVIGVSDTDEIHVVPRKDAFSVIGPEESAFHGDDAVALPTRHLRRFQQPDQSVSDSAGQPSRWILLPLQLAQHADSLGLTDKAAVSRRDMVPDARRSAQLSESNQELATGQQLVRGFSHTVFHDPPQTLDSPRCVAHQFEQRMKARQGRTVVRRAEGDQSGDIIRVE